MRIFKEIFIIGVAGVAAIYLINPTAGFLELIPDNFPFVGNLDEATATLILLNTLRYYGLDLTKLFDKSRKEKISERRTS